MRIRRFFRRAKWDRERLAEIESYVQIETDENAARGMRYDDAGCNLNCEFYDIKIDLTLPSGRDKFRFMSDSRARTDREQRRTVW